MPTPGSDDGTWGQILNDFLVQAHNVDGTLKQLAQSQVQNLVADLAAKVDASSLAPVATSGDYGDLANTPAIPSEVLSATPTGLSLLQAADAAGVRSVAQAPYGNGITEIQQITQAAYDALAVKSASTLYVIVG